MSIQLTTCYQTVGLSLFLAVLAGCGGGSSPTALVPEKSEAFAAVETTTEVKPEQDDVEFTGGISLYNDEDPNTIRVMAANITSGNYQSYDPGHGTRIFQGLQPDIILIQEFNHSSISSFISNTFGSDFQYFREGGAQIPNGVISRYPIVDSGEWDDSYVSNRDHVWARINIPGDKDLWAISVHWLTNDSMRDEQAAELVNYINQNVPNDDYLIVGGDFNTDSRSELSLNILKNVVDISAPFPKDQNGREGTNASRSKPYDAVYVDADLESFETPVVIGNQTFPGGLVFDSRVFSPLSAVAPVQSGDSGATNMQHMAVIRDFLLPGGTNPTPAPTPTPVATPTPATGGSSVALTSGVTKNDSVGTGQWDQFYIDVPAGATQLQITMTGSGDADLYVKKGAQPTSSSYDQRPYLNGSAETVTISNPSSGRYYIGVNGYTSANYALTATVSQGSTPTPTPAATPTPATGGSTSALTSGVTKNDSVGTGQWDQFYIDVPAGATQLQIEMTGSGDADLYVKKGAQPTSSSYDQRPYLNGSAETVTISNPSSGRYYIGVNGYSTANYSLKATVTQGSAGGGSTSQPVTLLNQSGTVAQGQWQNYTINVPSGKSKVTVTMTGTGDADLYIKYGSSYPTLSSYDYRPYLNGSSESVVISGSALQTGQYWISINGYASSSSYSVSAVAE
jgi:endonuclease/exonuclease/phosphatase family metal-dependent hydrolase